MTPSNNQGESSTPKGVRVKDRFGSVKDGTDYEEWMRKRRFILFGHVIKHEDFTDGFDTIISNFVSVGWQNL